MAIYTISKSEIQRRKRKLLLGLVWGVFVGVLLYAKNQSSLLIPIAVGLLFGGFMVFVNWRHNKEFFAWAPNHSLEINKDLMVINDPGAKTDADLRAISKIYVNLSGRSISSLVIVREGKYKERMPQYSDLRGLLEEMKIIVGEKNIEYRKWLHV